MRTYDWLAFMGVWLCIVSLEFVGTVLVILELKQQYN